VAIIGGFVYFLQHFDDPYAILKISDDSAIAFTQDVVLELTEKALRQIDLTPIRPEPAYGDDDDPEPFVGRNALRPNDWASVIWSVHGGSYPTYTVDLERTPTHITATISENWL
jgi:hypothetical protein